MPIKLAVLASAVGVAACSTTATVHRRGGGTEDVEILNRRPTALVVEGQREIPLDDVADIDHPGNVVAIVGSVLFASALVDLAVARPDCGRNDGALICGGVALRGAIGVAMIGWGHYTWSKSKHAAETGTPAPALSVAPWVARAAGGYRGGLALGVGY
jgi:hypothetical protein